MKKLINSTLLFVITFSLISSFKITTYATDYSPVRLKENSNKNLTEKITEYEISDNLVSFSKTSNGDYLSLIKTGENSYESILYDDEFNVLARKEFIDKFQVLVKEINGNIVTVEVYYNTIKKEWGFSISIFNYDFILLESRFFKGYRSSSVTTINKDIKIEDIFQWGTNSNKDFILKGYFSGYIFGDYYSYIYDDNIYKGIVYVNFDDTTSYNGFRLNVYNYETQLVTVNYREYIYSSYQYGGIRYTNEYGFSYNSAFAGSNKVSKFFVEDDGSVIVLHSPNNYNYNLSYYDKYKDLSWETTIENYESIENIYSDKNAIYLINYINNEYSINIYDKSTRKKITTYELNDFKKISKTSYEYGNFNFFGVNKDDEYIYMSLSPTYKEEETHTFELDFQANASIEISLSTNELIFNELSSKKNQKLDLYMYVKSTFPYDINVKLNDDFKNTINEELMIPLDNIQVSFEDDDFTGFYDKNEFMLLAENITPQESNTHNISVNIESDSSVEAGDYETSLTFEAVVN